MKRILSFRNDWKGLGKKGTDYIGGVGYYRIIKPLLFLREKYSVFDLGDIITAQENLKAIGKDWPIDDIIPNLVKDCDLVFMKNISHPGGLALFAGAAEYYDKPLIVDMDDNYLSVDDLNPNRKYFQEGALAQITHKELWKSATAMTVSTQPLVSAYQEFNKNIHVLENYNDINDWKFEKAKHPSKIVIGWAGSQTHEADFAIIKPVIETLWKKYGNKIVFAICGGLPKKMTDALPKESFVIFSGTRTMQDYPKALASWGFDIGIAPLVENTFNDGKSHGKWMEYAMYKIPTVASNFGPYKRVVEDGSTGLLANSTEEWVDKISQLVDDEKLRQQIGQTAYDVVVKDFQWRSHAWRWAEVFDRYIGGGFHAE
jgi:glycosyltransferase involved in cell wall biosynthesis